MSIKDIINPNAAGIDIGADKFYVCVAEGTYKVFTTYHEDCLAIVAYLKENGIRTVAFESTGVYWMHLYDVLQSAGLEVCLANPIQTKRRVTDSKSDVSDCQWIRHLHVRGMLRGSFIPAEVFQQMRMVLRMREDNVRSRAQQESILIKVLTMMNVRLKEVINSVTSVSGQAIIESIIAGQTDPKVLLSLAHKSITSKKSDALLKALDGNYLPHYVFMLSQAFENWTFFGKQIASCDERLAAMMDTHIDQNGYGQIPIDSKPKSSRSNNFPAIDDLHQKVVKMTGGLDLASITCVSDYTAMKLIMEIGTDLSRFPSHKQFSAWLGLAPKSYSSGKTKRRAYSPSTNAGQIIRQAASTVLLSRHNALGEFGRRISARRGRQVAIKAVARKIAVAIYNMLVHGQLYVEEGIQKYKQQIEDKEMKMLNRLANKLGFELSPSLDPSSVSLVCA